MPYHKDILEGIFSLKNKEFIKYSIPFACSHFKPPVSGVSREYKMGTLARTGLNVKNAPSRRWSV